MRKTEAVRRRILEKAQSKYLFRVEPLWAPVGLLTHGDRLEGLRFARTRLDEDGRAVRVPGEVRNVETKLTISSIGSIPEPIEGLPMDGELLRLEGREHGKLATFENVFGCGNVVTGKGNLVASRHHSTHVAKYLSAWIDSRAADANGHRRLADVLARVRARQQEVGYTDYAAWIEQAAPERAA
jgi:hypothetical protein